VEGWVGRGNGFHSTYHAVRQQRALAALPLYHVRIYGESTLGGRSQERTEPLRTGAPKLAEELAPQAPITTPLAKRSTSPQTPTR